MNQQLAQIKNAVYSALPKLKEVHRQLEKVEDTVPSSALSLDERQVYDIFRALEDKLGTVVSELEYLKKPIIAEGNLRKNRYGRYEIGEYELSCGYGIEVLIYDDYLESERWVKTRVEHNGDDYYLYSFPKLPMQGLKARVRR